MRLQNISFIFNKFIYLQHITMIVIELEAASPAQSFSDASPKKFQGFFCTIDSAICHHLSRGYACLSNTLQLINLLRAPEMISLNDVIRAPFKYGLNLFSGIHKKQPYPQKPDAKRHTPHSLALEAALSECRKEAKKSIRWRIIPSSEYFERAAMLFRQSKNYQNEIKICQLYISLVDECLSKKTFNRSYLEIKAQEQCRRIASRLETVQKLHEKIGIEVTEIDIQSIRNG